MTIERQKKKKKEKQVYVKINRTTHLQALHSSSSPLAMAGARVTGRPRPFAPTDGALCGPAKS